jgi:hypothetical protein
VEAALGELMGRLPMLLPIAALPDAEPCEPPPPWLLPLDPRAMAAVPANAKPMVARHMTVRFLMCDMLNS